MISKLNGKVILAILPAPKPKRIRPSLSTNTDTQAVIPQPLTVPTEPDASALARPMLEVVAPVKPQIAAIPSAADLPKAPSSAEVLRALEQLEARMQALEERQARANKNAARQYKSKSASDFSY